MDVRGDAAGADRAVALVAVEQVREPLEPFPVGHPVPGAAEGDVHVVGGVGGGGLHEQRAGDAQHALAVADDAGVARAVERDGQRQITGGAEAADERPGLVEHEPVGRGEHAAALLPDGQRAQRHLAAADAHLEEVGVEPPPLPQPGRVAHDVVERGGRRVQDPGRLAQFAFLGDQFLAQLLQVLQIALALLAAGALGLAALRQQHADAADDGDDQDDGADGGELAVPYDRHHHDGAHHTGHRQQRHRAAAGLALGQIGRCLDGAGGGAAAGRSVRAGRWISRVVIGGRPRRG